MPADLDAIMDTNDPFVRFDDIDNRSYQDIQGMGLTPPFHPKSYSSDTEVYTNEGWKALPDVTGEELFLSPNPNDGMKLEWVEAGGTTVYDPGVEMYHIHSQNFDLLVTPDHSQVFSSSPWNRTKKWQSEEVQAIANRPKVFIPRCANWEGGDFGFVRIPGMIKVRAIPFFRFMAFWLSDGSVLTSGPNSYRISIANRKSQRQIYTAVMAMMPWKAVQRSDTKIVFSDSAIGVYLSQFGHANRKFIPDVIKNASSELITEFLNAYLVCDGNRQTGKYGEFDARDGSSLVRVFYTTSPMLAGDIGECILKAGGYPRFITQEQSGTAGAIAGSHTFTRRHDLIRVYWNKSKTATFGRDGRGTIEVVQYDGLAYCVMLKKNHVLWVRRNGKTCFSGNCRCTVVLLDRSFETGLPPDSPLARAPIIDNKFIVPTDKLSDRNVLGKFDMWDDVAIRKLAHEMGFPAEINELSVVGQKVSNGKFRVGLTGNGKGKGITKLGISFATDGAAVTEAFLDNMFLTKTGTGRGRELTKDILTAFQKKGAKQVKIGGGVTTDIGNEVWPKLGFQKERGGMVFDLEPGSDSWAALNKL